MSVANPSLLAKELLTAVGPGKILHIGCIGSSLISALLENGCDAYGYSPKGPAGIELESRIRSERPATRFDTVIVELAELLPEWQGHTLFAEVRGLVGKNLVLIASDDCGRPANTMFATEEAVHAAAIQAGFRRHPGTYSVAQFNNPASGSLGRLLCYELITDETLALWPIERLLADRDHHMDMTREAGARADAHLARYALAAEWVRPGDVVLDCACGLGYGTRMLAMRSSGGSFLGVDVDPGAIAYATENFHSGSSSFFCASATKLEFLDDSSVDTIASFETLEHLEDYESCLVEFARVLRPDGRLIVSVPNLWIDDSGLDPNPHHHHVFDYRKLFAALAKHFLVEARFAQSAPGGFKLPDATRSLTRLPLQSDSADQDAEWWILVASSNPLGKPAVPFARPEFDRCVQGVHSNVATFGDHYENPWIYRAWIQVGPRLADEATLDSAISDALEKVVPTSADYGGLLSVLAYSALRRHDLAATNSLLGRIAQYLQPNPDNPHVYRWCISLEYVSALLHLSAGRRNEARIFLQAVTRRDPLRFSPLISTKLIAANFLLGIFALVDGDEESARNFFSAGVSVARRALHADDVDAIGNPEHPLTFGFVELAEIADMASQCAAAIHFLPRYRDAPGVFWRHVDMRRFGMIAWIKALQEENAALGRNSAALRKELEDASRRATLRILVPLRAKEIILEILPSLLRRLWHRMTRVSP